MKKCILLLIICFSVLKGYSQPNYSDFNVPLVFPSPGVVPTQPSNIITVPITTEAEAKIARDIERIYTILKNNPTIENGRKAYKELLVVITNASNQNFTQLLTAANAIKTYYSKYK